MPPKLVDIAADLQELTKLLDERETKQEAATKADAEEKEAIRAELRIVKTQLATLQAPPVTGWKVLLSLAQGVAQSEKAVLLLLGGLLSLIGLVIVCAAGLLHEHPGLWPWGAVDGEAM